MSASVDHGENRPNPEALLAESRTEQGGGLRIFLGAAPGVGKTYAMLQAARESQASGRDVVIGVVESHGRAETEALCDGLERIRPQSLEHRGRTFEEFDLDAALARHPDILLMDELAHRNIPGTRHPRRYQDIRELLHSGIEVWTTLNIQHLESLNDTVARITGVRMRETVPDDLLDVARDLKLVDLSPRDLLKRLEQGKVYVPEQARAAMAGFFSPSNLAALRELAFTTAVDRVDADVRQVMRRSGQSHPLPVRDRVIVGIGADSGAERLIRAGRRIADAHRAPWIVAHVETSPHGSESGSEAGLEKAFALARSLGAETRQLRGTHVEEELLRLAESENATTIVLGQGRLKHGSNWFGLGKASRLMRRNRHFDLTLVAPADERPPDRAKLRSTAPTIDVGSPRDSMLAAAVVATAVLVSALLEQLFPLQVANLSLVFLTGVLLLAARTSLWPALAAAGLSFLLYNFFFTEPRLTFTMTDPSEIVTVVLFLIMAIIGANIAARMRSQLQMLRATNEQARTLLRFSERLAEATDANEVQRAAVAGCRDLLERPVAFIARTDDSSLSLRAGVADALMGESEQTAAEWSLRHAEAAGFQTDTLPRCPWRYLPIIVDGRPLGSLAVRFGDRAHALGSGRLLLLDALIQLIALNLNRTELAAHLQEARLSEESERLRSAILASLSHDLRTPLASMIGSGSALRDYGHTLSDVDRAELLETIIAEGERLNRYIGNLFDMTRLGHGTLKVTRDWIGIDDIVAAAIQRTSRLFENVRLVRRIPQGLPLLNVHPALIEQALINVLENAARFSSAGQTVTVAASVVEGQMILEVTDQGPGIPPQERDRIFNMFFSGEGGDTRRGGSGLGLAICQGMIGAHGGQVEADSGPGGVGTTIRFILPLSEQQPEPPDA